MPPKRNSDEAAGCGPKPPKNSKGDPNDSGLEFRIEGGSVECEIDGTVNNNEFPLTNINIFQEIHPCGTNLKMNSIGTMVIRLKIPLGDADSVDITPSYDARTRSCEVLFGRNEEIPLRLKLDWGVFLEKGEMKIKVPSSCSPFFDGELQLVIKKTANSEGLQAAFRVEDKSAFLENVFVLDSSDSKILLSKKGIVVECGQKYCTKLGPLKKNL